MILITGMPRSGTTFLLQLFNDGKDNFEKKYHVNFRKIVTDPKKIEGQNYNTNEPFCLSNALWHGENIIPKLKEIEEHYNDCDGELIIKQPQAIFASVEELSYFSKIIVCIRDNKTDWVKSAKMQNADFYLSNRPNWLPSDVSDLEGMYESWKMESIEKLLCLNVSRCIYEYNNDSTLHDLLEKFKYKKQIISKNLHESFDCWKGSKL